VAPGQGGAGFRVAPGPGRRRSAATSGTTRIGWVALAEGARLEFEPTAAEAYDKLTDQGVLDKIDAVLDSLEQDPGQARLRAHRWSDPPLWGVTARARDRDRLILWGSGAEDARTVVIYYLGPDA
jgi:hypothetical protein